MRYHNINMSTKKRHFDQAISYIEKLERGWDDEDALVPSQEVVAMTRKVYDGLMKASGGQMDEPSTNPTCRGSIDLYWATRKSEDKLWCGDNLVRQFLLNISDENGMIISYYGTMDANDDNADRILFEGTPEEFFALDLTQFNRFHSGLPQ